MHFFFRARFVCGVLIASLLALTVPELVSAQASGSLSVSPAAGSYPSGKTFTIAIVADASQQYNSANATLSFDITALQVTGVSKNNSAFSLWAVEPSFSNTAGTVGFEGGNITPLTGRKTLLEVTFRPLKEGKTDLTITAGSILAADGKGTDLLGTKSGASYTISPPQAAEPAPQPKVQEPAGGEFEGILPDAPIIASPTHPSETAYSSAAKAKFTWDLPGDVTAVRLALDTKEKTIPTTSYDPAITEKEFDQLTEGVMYFHLRYRNDTGWGPTAHRKLMIDKTPPPDFTLEVPTAASSTEIILKFNATDTLSGIDRYEISVDGGNPLKVSVNDMRTGAYTLAGQIPGSHNVKVSAFDKAGNSTPKEAAYTIIGENANVKKIEEEESKPIDWRLIGDIALISIIAFLAGYLWYERNAFRHEKYLAKREADELRDHVGSIFSAIRDELSEQVGRLFEKPNPSARDRETMKSINEAVDLSEELISKEVEDVRKLLS